MASSTYLQLVNDVLIRLRENEVSSVSDNAYSKLIGKFVNDAKRQCEDAYNWNALSQTLSAVTTASLFNYVLTGSGQRFRVIDVIDDTSNAMLELQTTEQMNKLFLTQTAQTSAPKYYNFNGVNSNGDTQVDLYPIPDGVYNLRFNIIKPQLPLAANSDTILIPSEPVVFNALARAMGERGEDGGIASNEAFAMYKQSLSDAIALESGRYLEESAWTAP
jgi:hypothetical protein